MRRPFFAAVLFVQHVLLILLDSSVDIYMSGFIFHHGAFFHGQIFAKIAKIGVIFFKKVCF